MRLYTCQTWARGGFGGFNPPRGKKPPAEVGWGFFLKSPSFLAFFLTHKSPSLGPNLAHVSYLYMNSAVRFSDLWLKETAIFEDPITHLRLSA
jgi:hypothetical protein